MANELKNTLDQIKTDLGTITGIQRVQLGQLVTAIPEATLDKCYGCVYMRQGKIDYHTFTAAREIHLMEMRFYWLLQAATVEKVEQSMATMWDRLMTEFFGDDGDRNL